MFDNSIIKPFVIADNNALSELGRGILSYLCPLAGGILSEGDFVRGIMSGGFCPFPSGTISVSCLRCDIAVIELQ